MNESDAIELLRELPPRRGLILAKPWPGQTLSQTSLEQWIFLTRTTLQALKADIFIDGLEETQWCAATALGKEMDLALTVASRCGDDPPSWRPAPMAAMDILLRPDACSARMAAWVAWAKASGLPVRLELPLHEGAEGYLESLLDGAEAWLASLLAYPKQGASPSECRPSLALLMAQPLSLRQKTLVTGLARNGLFEDIENVLPLAKWPQVEQLLGYSPLAVALAARVSAQSPRRAQALLHSLSAQASGRLSQADNFVLSLTLHKRLGILAMLEGLHRLYRFGAKPAGPPPLLEATGLAAEHPSLAAPWSHLATKSVEHAAEGSFAFTPYIDVVDRKRLETLQAKARLAEAAQELMSSQACDLELSTDAIEAENAHTIELPGARRWFSVAGVEKRSAPLIELSLPWTLRVRVGGGHAAYGGFALGRHGRIMTPLSLQRHTLTLHCDASGHYVFLRDDHAVEPEAFSQPSYVPSRIPDRCAPQLVLWNIDKEVVVQTPQLWYGKTNLSEEAPPRFSFLIVSVRYARRLQAALMCLARQAPEALGEMEILVAYVPELDATDDVLNSFENAFPALRIVRMPYSAQDARSKGFLINETVARARGEWVVIMDSDILVPQDFVQRLRDAARDNVYFIAPDGRKMVDPITTGQILLGLIDPYESWERLVAEGGEYRKREAGGLPIGFLQCVRRSALLDTPYEEWGHFEGADWRFADDMRQKYGPEHWLEGVPVLHLDHGGSQWYGATRQF